VIVRWGLDGLSQLLRELAIERPLLITSNRFAELEVPVAGRFSGVRRHAPVDAVAAATEAARELQKIASGRLAQLLLWRDGKQLFVTVKKD